MDAHIFCLKNIRECGLIFFLKFKLLYSLQNCTSHPELLRILQLIVDYFNQSNIVIECNIFNSHTILYKAVFIPQEKHISIVFNRVRNPIARTGRKWRLRERISVKQALEPNEPCRAPTDADEMRVGSLPVAQCNYLFKKNAI